MVRQARKPKAGGRRNPNAARRNPHKPAQWPQSHPSCIPCLSMAVRCDGGKPCSRCAKKPPLSCTYTEPTDVGTSAVQAKQLVPVPKQGNLLTQTNSQDNPDVNDQVSSSNTHEAEGTDAKRFGKQPALSKAPGNHLTKGQCVIGRAFSDPLNRNVPPTSTKLQVEATGPSAAMGPPAAVRPYSTPYTGKAPQPESLTAAKHEDSRSRDQSQHNSHLTVSEDDLMDKTTKKLKIDTKIALVAMMKQLRSSTKDKGPLVLPPLHLGIYLLNIYRMEVFFLFPFFNLTMFISAFSSLYDFGPGATDTLPDAFYGLGCSKEAGPQSPIFQCALFMMLSHATIFSGMKEDHKMFVSRAFWECAVAFITPHLLKTNSLAAVQTFLIISVSCNSSRFPVPERRLPIELAYRLARHMRIDVEDDGVKRTLDEIDVRRRAWYGCVIMTLYSQSPKNYHLPLISTITRTPLLTDKTQSGSIPSSYFTNCILRCEELEQKLKEMPKTRSHILPEEGSSQFPHILAEMPKMLTKFVAVLPAVPSWTKLGLPAAEVDSLDSDPQAAVCNARLERPDAKFVFIRSMLFGPILMQLGIEECLASGVEPATIKNMVKDRTYYCAVRSLETAVYLLDYMHKRSEPVVRSQKVWWWNPYHVSTAGLVVVMAQTSPILWATSNESMLIKAWTQCQELLAFDKTNVRYNQELLKYLWDVNSSISGLRILQNDRFILSGSMPSMIRSQNSDGTWNLRMDPNSTSGNPTTVPHFTPSRTAFPPTTAARNLDAAIHPETMSFSSIYNQPPSTPSMSFTPSASAPASSMPLSQPLLATDMAYDQQNFSPDLSSYQDDSAFNMDPSLPSWNIDFATSNASDPVAMFKAEIADTDELWGLLPFGDWTIAADSLGTDDTAAGPLSWM